MWERVKTIVADANIKNYEIEAMAEIKVYV